MGAPHGASPFVTPLLGLHHVTALAGDAQTNIDYYTRTVGLRLVKHTVNYDDPGSHHFYYADAAGMPGSVLTFFPWGHARAPRKGSGQTIAVAFTASTVEDTGSRFGQGIQTALDPDGMALEFVADPVPQRLHSVTVCVADLENAERFFGETLGLRRVGQDENRSRFAIGETQFIDLLHEPAAEPGKMGAGSIHHVALRAGTEDALAAWREHLMAAGLRVSPVKDRTYFHSIYFRCAGNALFEIATDGPGFTIDEAPTELGQRLCLPPWLEQHRAEIEGRLSPVHTGV